MKSTTQSKNQNIIQHGMSVFRHTSKLISGDTDDFILPSWFIKYKSEIIKNLHDFKTIKHYNIWHDISKPYVRTIDTNGKNHYPNHAEESQKIWSTIFPEMNTIGRLIGNDMLFHTSKNYDEIRSKNLSIADKCTLLITALSEIHSNATMFGGTDSDSFKIKFKKLQKIGATMCDEIFNTPYVYVIVRDDLTPPQKTVQSCHAIIEATRNFNMNGTHPTVIVCAVGSEGQLYDLCDEIANKRILFARFYEPDIGDQLTAIATEPVTGDTRLHFRHLQLLQ